MFWALMIFMALVVIGLLLLDEGLKPAPAVCLICDAVIPPESTDRFRTSDDGELCGDCFRECVRRGIIEEV